MRTGECCLFVKIRDPSFPGHAPGKDTLRAANAATERGLTGENARANAVSRRALSPVLSKEGVNGGENARASVLRSEGVVVPVTLINMRVLAIHDISCFGRCSMQVIIPVLSHFGLQVCPLPTALLSTHTGGFEGFTFLDLTDEMKKIMTHWKSLNLRFDAIYSGFLGNAAQIDTVSTAIRDFPDMNAVIMVDPVMGDNGEIYKTYTPEMCAGMHRLCENAHIITPNLTEACLLAGIPYDPSPDEKKALEILEKVSAICKTGHKAVILHGVSRGDRISTYYSDSLTADNDVGRIDSPYCPAFFPGCGDLLASLILGEVMSGAKIGLSVSKASDFISKASFATLEEGTPHNWGIEFEKLLEDFEI